MQDKGSKEPQRIAKLLARAGVASRREIERMIADGRVAIDGVAVDTPATLLPSLRGVTVDGIEVKAATPARLFLFHKPAGTLTAERDFTGRRTIYDVLPKDLPRLMPVGRLDLNTEGLLLMSTDGEFKRQLELPSTGVERAYRARAYGPVTQEQLEDLIDGITIDGVRYGPIDANLERRTGTNVWIEMVLTEGKNREVRRVLEYLGLRVSRLIRTRYGPFLLADLPEGEIGEVRQHDLIAFRQALAKGAKVAQAVAVSPPRVAEPKPAPRPAIEPDRPLRARTATPVRSPRPVTHAAQATASGEKSPRPRRDDPSPGSRGASPERSLRGRSNRNAAETAPQTRTGRPAASERPARAGVSRSQRGGRPDPSENLVPGKATHRPRADSTERKRPPRERMRPADAAVTEPETEVRTPRPKVERKVGWAKPKIKPGPTGRKKPRR